MGRGRQRLQKLSLCGQFALSLSLLSGTGLFIHSLWQLNHVQLGFRTDHLLTFYLNPNSLAGDPQQAEIRAYYRRMVERLNSVHGVLSTAVMAWRPLDSLGLQVTFALADQPNGRNLSQQPKADFQMLTPSSIRTLGIQLLAGRSFDGSDTASSVRVAMVNDRFVKRFFPHLNPLGQRLLMEDQTSNARPGKLIAWQIVGVFQTVRTRSVREANPEIDVDFWQSGFPVAAIAVRTLGNPNAMVKQIHNAVNEVDPDVPLAMTKTMSELRNASLVSDHFATTLFSSFASLALFLSTIGMFGVVAFSAGQRSREIALRLAVGATRTDVIAMMCRESAAIAGTGMLFGCAGAFLVGSAIRATVFETSPVEWPVSITAAVLLLFCSMVASFLPAWRASRLAQWSVLTSA